MAVKAGIAEGITLLEAWIKLFTKGPDAAQEREVDKSLETFRVGLSGLITAATVAAVGVSAALTEMSQSLAKVYYEAGRIGSTTERVKAFGQAVAQAGGSGPAAIADLEKFSEKFRVNPAFREAIKNLGHLSAEDMKDAQSAYVGLSKVLAEQRKTDPLTYGRSQKFAGIDEATVMAIGRPKFDEANKDALEFDKGLEEIAEKSVRLNQDWLKVKQHLGTIFDLASGKWMDIESGMLEQFDKFLDDHKELFQKLSDAIESTFIDEKGQFDLFASSKRVYPYFLNWLRSIGFTKLKNAFVAFANWLTTGWLADKIKGVFGSLGSTVRAVGKAIESGVGLGAGPTTPGDDIYALDHPGWRPGMPKEKTQAEKEGAPVASSPPNMPQPGTQEYAKKGGYGPFSREQTQGAGQDFNIPGVRSGHPTSGKINVPSDLPPKKRADVDKSKPRPDEFITHPDIHYDQDPNMPAVRDPSGVLGERLRSNKIQRYLEKQRVHNILASINAQPHATFGQQSRYHEGSKTQDIRVTINTTDPHSAASETARQLAHLQNQTMRDWRRVG